MNTNSYKGNIESSIFQSIKKDDSRNGYCVILFHINAQYVTVNKIYNYSFIIGKLVVKRILNKFKVGMAA